VLRAAPSASAETMRRNQVALPVSLDETVMRAPVPLPTAAPDEQEAGAAPRRRRTGLWIGLGAAALVVVAIIVGVSLPGLLGGTPAPQQTEEESDPQDPVSTYVEPVTDVVGTVGADGVTFTWTNPDPQEGDYYIVEPVSLGGDAQKVDDTVATVPAAPGQTCIDVTLVRAKGTPQDSNTPTRGCTP
jgi:hypothetical protein